MPLGVEQLIRGVHPKAVRGLFHGRLVNHGYQCVDKGKRPRVKRDWQPNVQRKRLYSEVLQRDIGLDVTTAALKQISRAGGLDMYLLTNPVAAHGSVVAEELRNVVRDKYREKGLPLPQKRGPTSRWEIVQPIIDSLRPEKSAVNKLSPDPEKEKKALKEVKKPRTKRGFLSWKSTSLQLKKHKFPPPPHVPAATAWRPALKVPYTRLRTLRPKAVLKGVPQAVREAVYVAKIEQHALVKRRIRMIANRRGQALNALMRQRALEAALDRMHRNGTTPFMTLQQHIDTMWGTQREMWMLQRDRYQPNVPGMILKETRTGQEHFIPAVNRHAGYTGDEVGKDKEPNLDTNKANMRKIFIQMSLQGRKKLTHKLTKWLDDDWLSENVVPTSDEFKFVLPNGMVLWNRRRRVSAGLKARILARRKEREALQESGTAVERPS